MDNNGPSIHPVKYCRALGTLLSLIQPLLLQRLPLSEHYKYFIAKMERYSKKGWRTASL